MQISTPSLTFDLIKTLEPTEKAYIKKQFSANEKNLKQLFDDLNKIEIYNKTKFKIKNKTKTYIAHLSQNKTYLRKKIIDALIHYNAKSIPQISQRNLLNMVNILIHKGLLLQAVKLIQQGLQENEHLERFMLCYELCSLIAKLSVNNVSYTIPKETLKFFKQKKRFYIRQLSLIERFSEFSDIHYSDLTDEEKLRAIEENFKLFELEKNELPDDYPFLTKRMFYFLKYKHALFQNKPHLTIQYLEKTIKLYFKYPHFLQKDYAPFITDSLNFLNSLLINKLYDQFYKDYDTIILKIDEIVKNKIKNDFITSYYVIKYFFFQLACSRNQQYQKAYTFSTEYLQFISNKKNLSGQFLAASRVSIAVAQINVQCFKEAIEITNSIQNTKFYQYQYELRLIQIIAHYRLGNDLVLDSLFTSFIYYLKKQNKPEQTKAIRTLKKCMEKQNFDALQKVEFDKLESLNLQFALTTTLSADKT